MKNHQPFAPVLEEYQTLLFPIAYNLVRRMDDAEDLVQETMLKWWSLDRSEIRNERAYLVRILVNKCLNFLRDHQREQVSDVAAEYEDLLSEQMPSRLDLGPSVSLGVQAMLAKLSPQERAVFLLKEVFHFSHREIAATLDLSEEYCRQILRRARQHLRAQRERYAVDPEQHEQLFRTFVEVCQGQDLSGLLELLKEDIEVEIARPAAAVSRWQGATVAATQLLRTLAPVTRYRLKWLAGLPALVAYLAHQPVCIIRLDAEGAQITRLQVEVLDLKNMRILRG